MNNTLAITLGLVKFNPCHVSARLITHSSTGEADECDYFEQISPDDNQYKVFNCVNKGYSTAMAISKEAEMAISTVRHWLRRLVKDKKIICMERYRRDTTPNQYFVA